MGSTLCAWASNLIIALRMLPVMQIQSLREVAWTVFVGIGTITVPCSCDPDAYHGPRHHKRRHKHSDGTNTATASTSEKASVGFPESSSFTFFANGATMFVFAYQGQAIFPCVRTDKLLFAVCVCVASAQCKMRSDKWCPMQFPAGL